MEVAENSDDELESALVGARQRERAKSKKLKKKEMKKAQRLRGIIASGTNHGACALPRRQPRADVNNCYLPDAQVCCCLPDADTGDYTAPQDEELFSLRDVHTQQQLDSMTDVNVGDVEVGSGSEDSVFAGESEESEVEFDSDDEMADRKRRMMDVEKNLDFLCGHRQPSPPAAFHCDACAAGTGSTWTVVVKRFSRSGASARSSCWRRRRASGGRTGRTLRHQRLRT